MRQLSMCGMEMKGMKNFRREEKKTRKRRRLVDINGQERFCIVRAEMEDTSENVCLIHSIRLWAFGCHQRNKLTSIIHCVFYLMSSPSVSIPPTRPLFSSHNKVF